jgi:hypothetical protein
MGHLINPISIRLSITSYWKSTWSTYNLFNYINLFRQDQFIFKFLDWFLNKNFFFENNYILSHYNLLKQQNIYYIDLYYYFFKENVNKLHPSLILLFNPDLTEKSQFNFLVEQRFNYFNKIILTNLYWKLFLFIFNSYINILKLPFQLNTSNFNFNFFNLNFAKLTPNIISNYISWKLTQKHRLAWVLQSIIKDLSWRVDSGIIGGYKILTSGRFTRKQIATYSWVKGGQLPLNQLTKLIKFSVSSVRLKYGVCGIKVWINYNNNLNINQRTSNRLLYPFYKPFNFNLNKEKNLLFIYLNNFNYFYLNYIMYNFIQYEIKKINLVKFYKLFLKRVLFLLFSNLINYLGNKTFVYSIKYLSNLFLVIKFKKINYLNTYYLYS